MATSRIFLRYFILVIYLVAWTWVGGRGSVKLEPELGLNKEFFKIEV